MATIRVPGPPPEAFRKHRPISDLIKSQIKHFQHLEHKLHLTLPTKFSPHDLTTEAVAAQYIAEVTTALCSQASAAQQPPTPIRALPPPEHESTSIPRASAKATRKPHGLSIAAAESPKKPRKKKSTASKHSRKKP
jgi:hypothetical protein